MIKSKLKAIFREWGLPLLIVLSIMAPLRSVVADYNYIPSGSMKPTLLVGDNVFVNKLAYDLKVPFSTWHLSEWGNPVRGEVVVFFSPKEEIRMVKRVVGLPGDLIEMKGNRLSINGKELSYQPAEPEQALSATEKKLCDFRSEALGPVVHKIMEIPFSESMTTFGPVKVPENKYFMMGDNRDNSRDSRFYGFVSRSDIVGRVDAVLWSKPMWQMCMPIADRFFRWII